VAAAHVPLPSVPNHATGEPLLAQIGPLAPPAL